MVVKERAASTAERWQQALASTGFAAISVPEVQAQLAVLAERAIRAIHTEPTEPVDRSAGRAIGVALADLRYTHPDALERTLILLDEELLWACAPGDEAIGQRRRSVFLAALAGGFTAEVRAITLAEQDAIRHAVLAERDQAYDELRAVLDAAVDSMVLISPERRTLMINRRFTETFDIAPEQIVGRRFEELRPLVEPLYANPQALVRLISRVAGSAEDAKQDLIQIRPQLRALQLHSVPVQRSDGALLGRLHIFRDVTREREIDRREREFLASVSHELRTPLTSIKGYVDLLLTEDLSPDETHEFLEVVQHNADRMRTLVNDIIDLSRLELGEFQLRPDWINLSALLESAVSALRPQLRKKTQDLTVDLPSPLPPIWGDTDRLTQVFTNLLVNANRYTPEGGHITVQAMEASHAVRVSIMDTGVGMSANEQMHLFTKFYRVRNRRTEHVQGTGLGLAICRSLVELHRGTISVQSAPGLGSTFTVTLPVGRPES